MVAFLEDGERLSKMDHDAKMLEMFKVMRTDEAFRLPVHYYIDEVHEIFPSREWTKGGRGVLYYTSKHRHLHDEIFLITQQIDQVEKQLRNLVSETAVCRNHARRNVGSFKAKPIIRVSMYFGIPAPTSKPFDVRTLDIDIKGIASCYKTTGALGVHTAPEKTKNKGWLPWWMMYIGGALAVLAVSLFIFGLPFLPGWMGRFASRHPITPGAPKSAPADTQRSGASVAERPQEHLANPKQVPSQAKPEQSSAAVVPVPKEVFVSNVVSARDPDRITVMLTDGRVFDENSGVRLELLRNAVKVGDRLFRFVSVGKGHFDDAPSKPAAVPAGASGRLEADAAPVGKSGS
jgi:hypothetical protein